MTAINSSQAVRNISAARIARRHREIADETTARALSAGFGYDIASSAGRIALDLVRSGIAPELAQQQALQQITATAFAGMRHASAHRRPAIGVGFLLLAFGIAGFLLGAWTLGGHA